MITLDEIIDNLYEHKNISTKIINKDTFFKVRLKTNKQLWVVETNDVYQLCGFLQRKGVKSGELISVTL